MLESFFTRIQGQRIAYVCVGDLENSEIVRFKNKNMLFNNTLRYINT